MNLTKENYQIEKLDYIDALRGVAILGVIMIHTKQYSEAHLPDLISIILKEGARGVQLFYLASAFTLFLSFKNRSVNERRPIRNFFIRRFFRIAPMYYLGIAYYLFQDGLGARGWLGDQTNITFFNILSNILFVHDFNPYWINSLVPGGWSIGIEMTFYCVLPILFLKIKNLDQAFKLFIFSIIFRAILHVLFNKFPLIDYDPLWKGYIGFYFPSQFPIFCLGILLYYLVIEKEDINKISGKILVLFLGLIFFQLFTKIPIFFPNHIMFGVGFFFLGYVLSVYNLKLIVNPIIRYFGKLSFSLYLIHFAVLHWLSYFNFMEFFQNSILDYISRFIVVFILSSILSSIFYSTIEIPFQRIGKNVISILEGRKNSH